MADNDTDIVQATMAELVLFLVFFMMIALVPAKDSPEARSVPPYPVVWPDDNLPAWQFQFKKGAPTTQLLDFVRGDLSAWIHETLGKKIFENPVLIIVGHSDGAAVTQDDQATKLQNSNEIEECLVEARTASVVYACMGGDDRYASPADLGLIRAYVVMWEIRAATQLSASELRIWPTSAGRLLDVQGLVHFNSKDLEGPQGGDELRRRVDFLIAEAPRDMYEPQPSLVDKP